MLLLPPAPRAALLALRLAARAMRQVLIYICIYTYMYMYSYVCTYIFINAYMYTYIPITPYTLLTNSLIFQPARAMRQVQGYLAHQNLSPPWSAVGP